jgi:DNA helicase-2/ATP-dependent DNA helicase PcrA
VTTDYLKDLSEKQREAVTKISGPSLVIAGAGSGKTRVLTYRIANILSTGIFANSILALTFTNKAAREMKDRIGILVGESSAKNLWMGTFHSIFARILRVESQCLGYSSTYTIYDSQDSKNAVRQIIKEMNLDDTIYKPGEIYSRISRAKNNLITAQAYGVNPHYLEADRLQRKPQLFEIYREYSTRCYKAGVMDFDDLLLNTNILFNNFPEVLKKYQGMFQYILVDEYQDTNLSQYRIVNKLAHIHHNLCVVGDDAQSIYSFRGAQIENILNFRNDYPDYKLFKLEQNYRSTQTIVNAANSLIRKNKNQIQKVVFSENPEGEKIKVLKLSTDTEEGFVVANSIIDTRMEQRLSYHDFAILYRTNAQSRIFEEALRKRNIPYKVYGGLSFYQRKEIKDLLAYLRLIVNNHDDEAFRRVINYPPRGIGDTTVGKIGDYARQNKITLFEVASDIGKLTTGINKGTQTKINAFVNFILEHGKKIQTLDAYEVAYQVAIGSGILTDLRQEKTPESISKLENLEELLNSIRQFSSQNEIDTGILTLEHFLENVALLTDSDAEKPEDNDRVTIMTIHSAKGLEFNIVYIVGMEENLFPSQLALLKPEDIEEERRLLYVAVTRARQKVHLSYAETRFKWGTPTNSAPSRFINDIEEQYLDLPKNSSAFAPGFDMDQSRTWNQKQKFIKNENKSSEPANIFVKPKNMVRLDHALATPLAQAEFQGDDPGKIQAGMEVLHERFGNGKVIHIEGDQNNIKATVFFQGTGQKQLLLKFAKLKII